MKSLHIWMGLKANLLVLLMMIVSCQSNQSNNASAASNTSSSDVAQSVVSPYKNISIADAKSILDATDDHIFLDVRTPDEVADGQISGSITIDINSSSFESEIVKLDKQKPYVVYCRSGSRSARAAKFMQSQGFENVSNVEGGYSAWVKAYK